MVIPATLEVTSNLSSTAVGETFKLLVVEDRRHDREALADILKDESYDIHFASTGVEAMEFLYGCSDHLLVVLDIQLPDTNGTELCPQIIKAFDPLVAYIIFWSADHTMETQQAAIGAGGNLFITKPTQPWELVLHLRSAANTIRAIRRATADQKTGLPSQLIFEAAASRMLYATRKTKDSVGVICLDIDHFKEVNDTYGHQIGDQVLRIVADRVKHSLRPEDILSRNGRGDEMTAILPYAYNDGTHLAAMRIWQAVRSSPLVFGEIKIAVTVSVGYTVENSGTVNELEQLADKRLYRAKTEGGRDCVWPHL